MVEDGLAAAGVDLHALVEGLGLVERLALQAVHVEGAARLELVLVGLGDLEDDALRLLGLELELLRHVQLEQLEDLLGLVVEDHLELLDVVDLVRDGLVLELGELVLGAQLELDPLVLALAGGVHPLGFACELVRERAAADHGVAVLVHVASLIPVGLDGENLLLAAARVGLGLAVGLSDPDHQVHRRGALFYRDGHLR